MKRLKELYVQNLLRNLMLEVQLKDALAAFRTVGIDPLVLKGLALANSYYSDHAARPTSDIDLLVSRKDFPAAKNALLQLGYHDLRRRFENLQFFFQESTFCHPRSEYCIDLHWAMHFVNRIDRAKEVRGLMERAVVVQGAKVSFRAQRTADEFIQASRHLMWNHLHKVQLIWIWDLKMMGIRLDAERGWQEVWDRAAEFHVAASTGRALELVRAWTGYSPPAPFDNPEKWKIKDSLESEIWSRICVGHMKPSVRLWLVWNPDWTLRRKICFGFRLFFPTAERVREDYPPPRPWLLFTSYFRRLFHAAANLFAP